MAEAGKYFKDVATTSARSSRSWAWARSVPNGRVSGVFGIEPVTGDYRSMALRRVAAGR